MANVSAPIQVNLNTRTIGKAELLWNRITPTRGSKSTCATISGAAVGRGVIVQVTGRTLSVSAGNTPHAIAEGTYYAAQLCKAGVETIKIPPNTTAEGVKEVLDTLCDRDIPKASRILFRRFCFNIHAPERASVFETERPEPKDVGDVADTDVGSGGGYSGGSDSVGGAMGGEDSYSGS